MHFNKFSPLTLHWPHCFHSSHQPAKTKPRHGLNGDRIEKHFPHNFISSEEKWLWAIIVNINSGSLHSTFSSSHYLQSDSHLLLHQAWIIKTTAKVSLPLFEIYIFNCCWNVKGKFNILSTVWTAIEKTRMTPISALLTRNLLSCLCVSGKCYASSKIIYPAWMLWICFSGFPLQLALFHYINLFYESRSVYLPFGCDVEERRR